MHTLRKYSTRYTLWLASLFCVISVARADGGGGGQVKAVAILDGGQHQIKKDSSITVEDSAFFNPSYSGRLDTPYSVQNQVTVMINEASTLYLRTNFSITVRLLISYSNAHGDTASTSRDFTVGYDSAGTYNSRSTLVFYGAHKVTVKVVSDTSNATTWDPASVLVIENQLTTRPAFHFLCSSTVSNITVSPSGDPAADELPVSWDAVLGADQYDLEWTYIDSSALDTTKGIKRYGSPYDPALIFRNNSTRITTTGTSYNIPLIFDNTGTLFIRVRPVQLGNAGAVTAAIWSSDASSSVMGQYTFRGHERPLNWQSSISFAEEGKRKVVVQYFDGSLRGRQTVTKDNTTNTTIVGETYYDYQGRPAIQVMPSPTLSNVIQYTAGFNVSFNTAEYSQSNYDTLTSPGAFCSVHADSMSNSSGASQYYSPRNPVANAGLNQFIPDAKDYPFTETEYTPDNTGRINRQGGVGFYHQLGSGHETKYFYGTPDQNELDALFGTEVGDKSHYFKNMVRDANGQYSVSYVDMHGRTIATALAGVQPSGMGALPSNNIKAITETLADSGSVSIQDQSMVSQKSLLVSKADTFTFNYSLLPDSLHELNCQSESICYTCRYDLDITITDNCNNQLLGGQPYTVSRHNFSLATLQNSCVDTSMNVNFSLLLPEGSYTITKRLTVNKDAYSFYRDSIYLPNNTCVSIGQFITQQKAVVAAANTQCSPSCSDCLSAIGDSAAFLVKYNRNLGLSDGDTTYVLEANAAFQAALSSCSSLCKTKTVADDILSAMLADMTPPYGQYADSLHGVTDQYSIFYLKPSPDPNNPYTPVFKLPAVHYLDDNGRPDSVFNDRSGLMVEPNSLTTAQFVRNFRPSWAKALLPYHPEYCKLQILQAHNNSLLWDLKMEAVDTYQAALDSGFLNPTGSGTIPFTVNITDPLTSTLGSDLQNKLINFKKLQNPNVTMSIWGLACAMVKCDSGSNGNSCLMKYSTISNTFTSPDMCDADRDMAWRNFRELYQGIKQDLFNQKLLQNPAGCHVVNPAYTSEPKVSTLYTAHHQPEFADVSTTTSRQLPTFPSDPNPTSAARTKAQAQASIDSFYNANSRSYATQWLQQLSACTVYNPSDIKNILIPGLTSLCRQACDSAHPYGASSLPTGVHVTVDGHSCSSFQDIINNYNQDHSITDTIHCNAGVITAPLPYYNQPIYTTKPVFARPSNCECSLINDLYSRYTVDDRHDASFSAYLLRTQQITMTDDDLSQLLSACSNTTNSASCRNFTHPIYLPPVMQCYAGAGCSSCQSIDSLYSAYKTQHPGQLPSISSDTDTAQAQKNLLFQNYMNNRLGYNIQAWQYLQFMDSCSAHTADTVTSSSCLPTTIAQLFNSGGTDQMTDIRGTSDGGYVLVGQRKATGASFFSAYIMRYNSAGNIQWAKTYTSTQESIFYKVRLTSDNGYVAVGTAYYSGSGQDTSGKVFVVKTDGSGNTIWQRSIGFSGSARGELAVDIIQTQDGGYAIVGDHNITHAHSGPATILVAKLNSTGVVTWADMVGNTGGGDGNDGYGLTQDADTLVVVGRQNGGVGGNVQGVIARLNINNGNFINSFAVVDSLSPDGSNYYGVQFPEIYVTSNGYKIYNYVSLNSDGSSARIGVMEVSPTGSVLSSRRFNVPPGDPGNATVASVAAIPTSDGGWLAGETSDFTQNIHWVRLDASNNTLWTRRTNLSGSQLIGSIAQKTDSSYTALGTDGGTAMLLNLSTVGAAGCKDSIVSITVTSPTLSIRSVTQPTSSLTAIYASSLTESLVSISSSLITCNQDSGTCYINYHGPILCGKSAPLLPPVTDSITACSDSTFFTISSATALFNTYSDSLKGDFEQRYLDRCMQAYRHESFTVTHNEGEYHYTLYYYDQAGNLIKTVPPAGVQQNTDTAWLRQVREARAAGTVQVPTHTLVTNYRYNTLNQVVGQHSPDGGTSYFWYDRLGRLSLSQNARQQPNDQYSYTQYDSIGRIIQVGQLVSSTAITDTISRVEADLALWEANAASSADQITVTTYDTTSYVIGPELGQRNVRNRVSWTGLFNTAADLANGSPNAAAASYFSYDILGNVDTLLQDYGSQYYTDVRNPMNRTGNRFKKIVYDFDLVSGKVNKVSYQHGNVDAFYHTYLYDAENRITNVQSSTDSVNWDNDAFYSYYAHGPLSRTVLGQQQVQGINYAYNLQGWLKSINPAPYTGGTFTLRPDSSNNIVANSAYNLLLNYFDGDFKPISPAAGPDSAVSTTLSGDYRPLYNGNISSMGVQIRGLSNSLLYNYQYDQLNRLIHMDAWNRTSTSWSAITKVPDFQESIAYDPNGNILGYKRNGNNTFAGQPIGMDSLNYFYTAGTNKLDHITDTVPSGNYSTDIDGQSSGNYKYDSVGELVSDDASGISNITWTVYGKIASITKSGDTTIRYTYDATGNRISKSIIHSTDTLTTWYVRDAQGNVLSVYTHGDAAVNGKALAQTELHIYGSSRLGIWKRTVDVEGAPDTTTVLMPLLGSGDSLIFTRGDKFFELKNHLGNVLATIGDKRYGVSTDDSTVGYYNPEIVSANDYYPFGSLQPGRSYAEANTGSYRYGFNGQEKSDEIKGPGSSYTADFWEYDPRIGRRWNLDPKPILGISQYSALNNNPIFFSDPRGDTSVVGAGGTQQISIDEKEYKLDFYGSQDYMVSGTSTKVPVQTGQLRSFSNFLGTFTARWIINESGQAVFSGYENEVNLTVDRAIKGLQDLENSWIGKFLKWGEHQYEESQLHPFEYHLKLQVNLFAPTLLASAEPLPYTPSYNPSVSLSELAPSIQLEAGVSKYINLFKPINEFDVSTTLYRGTTGSEVGSTTLFLTNDATVAASYIKNGGQVMQYQITQFSLKSLQASGELLLKTGINGPNGAVSTEYMFQGKDLIQALNSIAKPR